MGAGYGVRWIDNYYLSDEPPGESWLYDLLPDVLASATELEPHEHPFAAPFVQRVRTMLIEPAIYLNALLQDVHVAGGRVVVGELRDRREVAALPERVGVNCTGLGAADLFGDDQLVPAKGQLTILFPQPEVDYIAIYRGLYMFPRSDGILLGGHVRARRRQPRRRRGGGTPDRRGAPAPVRRYEHALLESASPSVGGLRGEQVFVPEVVDLPIVGRDGLGESV